MICYLRYEERVLGMRRGFSVLIKDILLNVVLSGSK